MMIGRQLRQFREYKNLSQGAIEQRTGLLRCYISRVENGHTVPAVETLEKFARALEVPLFALFYETGEREADETLERGPAARQTRRILKVLGQVKPRDRETLFTLAKALASRRGRR